MSSSATELRGVCLETLNVEKLVKYYEVILNIKSEGNNIHSVFKKANLAIYNPKLGENRLINHSAIQEKSFVLMFEVDNVDDEYDRLIAEGIEIVSSPEDKPWGTRAMSVLDPEGN